MSALLYGCEVWSLTVTMEKFPSGTYTRTLRRVLNTCTGDRVTNAELYGDLPIFVAIHDQLQTKAWSCWPLPPSRRIVSKSASLSRTLKPQWPSVYIHRWILGGIHQRTLCLHGQQSGLGGQVTSSAEAT